jgi:hypothetical protein
VDQKLFLKDLIGAPGWAIKSAKGTGKYWYIPFLICLTGGYALSVFMNNNLYLLLALSIGTFFSFIAQGNCFETTVVSVVWIDIQRLFRKKDKRKPPKPESVSLGLLGLTLGFIAIMILKPNLQPANRIMIFAPFIIVLFISIIVLLNKNSSKAAKQMMMLVFICAFGYLVFAFTKEIFAHDGGWSEGGSNWSSYRNSAGARDTFARARKPGLLGMIGYGLGSLFSTGYNAASWVGGKVYDGAAYVGGKAYDGAAYVGGKVYDGAAYVGGKVYDGAAYVGGKVYDGAAAVGNFVYEGGKIIGGEIYDIGKGAYDLAADIYNDPSILVEGVKNMGADIAEAAGQIKDFAVDAGNAIYDFGSDAVDLAKDIYDNPQILVDGLKQTAQDIGNGLKNAWDYTADLATDIYNNPQILVDTFNNSVDTVKNIASNIGNAIYTTVTDPKKAWEFVKDTVGLKNFGNCVDPNRSLLERLGQVGIGVFKLGSTIVTAGQAGTALKTAGSKGLGYLDDLAGAMSKGAKGAKSYVDDLVTKLRGGGKVVKPPIKTGPKLPVKPGPNYTTAGKADLTGIPKSAQKSLQHVADDMGVQIHVRPSNAASKPWIESGKAVPKPCQIKAKTLNPIDEMIGGPKNQEGLVGMFEPKKPPKSVLDKMSPRTRDMVNKRYNQRLDEWKRLKPEMDDLASQGKFRIKDGVVEDMQAGKRVAGDQDLFDITSYDGKPLPESTKQQVVDRLTGMEPSKVKHGSVTSWTKQGDPTQFSQKAKDGMIDAARQIQQNGKAGEGVITFNPHNAPTQSFYTK